MADPPKRKNGRGLSTGQAIEKLIEENVYWIKCLSYSHTKIIQKSL